MEEQMTSTLAASRAPMARFPVALATVDACPCAIGVEHAVASYPHVTPSFLTPSDYPWLRALLDEYDRFVGRPAAELRARLKRPLGLACDGRKLRVAVEVLDRTWRTEVGAVLDPRTARAQLFTSAARASTRDEAMAAACAELGVSAQVLEQALFSDLPGARLLRAPAEPMGPSELALRANLRMVGRWLERAHGVTIRARGNTRALVRQAKLRRLLCVVHGDAGTDDVELRVSGPLALFRQTAIYGRALTSLVPRLAWCRSFTLQAVCSIDRSRGPRTLLLKSGDPIFPAEEGRRFDSRLEERFARDFARAAPAWEIIREPRPVSAGPVLIFPDFALRRREAVERPWLLEIVGFWTREYLERKLSLLRLAKLDRFVLCIDEERESLLGELPSEAAVVRFRRRVDPAAVLAAIGGH
jgi:uncharacterized protein